MPNYIEQFNECTDPMPGDFVWTVDASASSTDKDRKLNLSRLALLAYANTFTANQRIDALFGVNAAPTTLVQLLSVAGATNRCAIRAKAAASPTVPALDVVNSNDTVRHQLWADYDTNIQSARSMSNSYQEFSINPGNLTTALTLTVNIVGTSFARQPVYAEVMGTFFNNNDNTNVRAIWVDDVTFSTRADALTNATIGVNTRRVSDINNVTVTGPTAIPAGIRYTVNTSLANLVRAGMTLRIQSVSLVTVTAAVA